MRLRRAQRGNGLAYGVLATALMILVVGALYDVYAAYHYRTWGYQAAGEAARTGTLAGTGLDYAAGTVNSTRRLLTRQPRRFWSRRWQPRASPATAMTSKASAIRQAE